MEQQKGYLRVLQVVNSLDGGEVARYVISLSAALDAYLTVGIASAAGGYPPATLPQGVRVHPLHPRSATGRGLGRALLDWPNLWRIARIVRQGAYDVVHTYQPLAGLWAWQAARLLGVPVVHTPAATGEAITAHERRLFTSTRLGRLSGASMIGRYVALSPYVQGWLHDVVGQPDSTIVANWRGVDVTALQPGRPRPALIAQLGIGAGPVLALVGPLEAVGRLDVAVGVLAQLRRSLPGTMLLVTGDGPGRAQLAGAAQGAGLLDAVVFATPQSLGPLLDLAHIALVIDPGPNLARPVLEALALAKPLLVVTDRADEEAMAAGVVQQGLNGWVLPAQPAIIAATLGGMLPLTGLLARMGAASRQLAERDFNLARHTQALVPIYQQAVGKPWAD